jgi:HrpA-like RNA helicase
MATPKRKRTLSSHLSRPRSGSDFGSSNIDPGPFGGTGPVDAVPNVPGPRSSPSTTSLLPSTTIAAAPAAVQHPTKIKQGKKAKKKKLKHPKTLVPEPVPKHAQRRRELPVYACRSQLLSTLRQHGTMVVKGETGSGKTTQIPQYLYEDGWTKKYGSMIAVTQPRRVAAMSVAERVAEEVGSSVGGRVGYRVRFDDATSSTTKIKFMTDGMLLRESMVDPLLSKYSVIVLDEAHERTLHTDILFAVVKQIQEQRNSPGISSRDGSTRSPSRSPLSLIVMSATLDTTMFSNYFNNAPIVDVPGRTYPIEMFYTKAPLDDYVAAALTCILQVHVDAQTRAGDMLVFLTGQEEIEDMARLLRERRKRLPTTVEQGGKVLDLLPCPIYAAMPTEQQMQAFAPAPFGCRKIVLATNVRMTNVYFFCVENGGSIVVCGLCVLGLQSAVMMRLSNCYPTGFSGQE